MTRTEGKEKRTLHETYYYPILFMIVLSVVFISVLAYLNEVTRETIEASAELKMQESVLYVLGIEHGGSPEAAAEAFESEVVSDGTVYRAPASGITAHAFEGSGLWGEIEGLISISSDGGKLMGVTFTKQSETPGLGGRIEEAWYRDQFRGIPLAKENGQYLSYKSAAGGNVDSISGATSTSDAVLGILNDSLETILGKGIGGE